MKYPAILCGLILVLVWGLSSFSNAATATSGVTLAASNLTAQATIQLLTCALVAALVIGLPGLLYVVFRIGKGIARREQAWRGEERTPPVIYLPSHETPALPAPAATEPSQPRRRVRRVRRPVSQAARLARRWFR